MGCLGCAEVSPLSPPALIPHRAFSCDRCPYPWRRTAYSYASCPTAAGGTAGYSLVTRWRGPPARLSLRVQECRRKRNEKAEPEIHSPTSQPVAPNVASECAASPARPSIATCQLRSGRARAQGNCSTAVPSRRQWQWLSPPFWRRGGGCSTSSATRCDAAWCGGRGRAGRGRWADGRFSMATLNDVEVLRPPCGSWFVPAWYSFCPP